MGIRNVIPFCNLKDCYDERRVRNESRRSLFEDS